MTNVANSPMENIENWEAVEEKFPKFWDFKKQGTYVGTYVENYHYESEKLDKPVEGYLFIDNQGFKTLLNQSYQIGQAIAKYGKVKYRIEYTGTTPLDGGRKVNNYKIATSTAI